MTNPCLNNMINSCLLRLIVKIVSFHYLVIYCLRIPLLPSSCDCLLPSKCSSKTLPYSWIQSSFLAQTTYFGTHQMLASISIIVLLTNWTNFLNLLVYCLSTMHLFYLMLLLLLLYCDLAFTDSTITMPYIHFFPKYQFFCTLMLQSFEQYGLEPSYKCLGLPIVLLSLITSFSISNTISLLHHALSRTLLSMPMLY